MHVLVLSCRSFHRSDPASPTSVTSLRDVSSYRVFSFEALVNEYAPASSCVRSSSRSSRAEGFSERSVLLGSAVQGRVFTRRNEEMLDVGWQRAGTSPRFRKNSPTGFPRMQSAELEFLPEMFLNEASGGVATRVPL